MLRQLRPAIMSVLVITVVFGLLFPGAITGIAQVAFHRQANGSLIEKDGKIVGSALIGQNFSAPGYFHPRPSAAGNGYDASNSNATNLGPTSAKLIGSHKKLANGKDDPSNVDGIMELSAAAYRKENGLPAGTPIPADAATRSASGLDPDISPANADLQVARVARTRKISEDQVRATVAACTAHRLLGFMGDPRVNVLQLNMALDAQ